MTYRRADGIYSYLSVLYCKITIECALTVVTSSAITVTCSFFIVGTPTPETSRNIASFTSKKLLIPFTYHLMFSNRAIFITAPNPWNDYQLNSAPFLYLHHCHCQSQHIHLLYPSPPGLPLKIKMSSLQTLLPWPIWSFTFSTWTTPTLTATLSPPGILEIGPELLLIPFGKPPFDSSQRSWISWCPLPWCA